MTEYYIDGVPISTIDNIIQQIAEENRFDLHNPSIREVNITGKELSLRIPDFQVIGMDMGIPGLPTPRFIVDAQKRALTREACSQYTNFAGIPELKEAASYFVLKNLGVYIDPKYCIPTVGGMHACHEAIGLIGRMNPDKDTLLFLTPGFSVNIAQAKKWRVNYEILDPDTLRGDSLVHAIEEKLRDKKIAGILWSSPNNPTWRVLSQRELQGIGGLCTKYETIAIEDNAYFGLDSRRELPKYANSLETVAHHTEYALLIFSGSKIFNYAGERIGVAVMSEKVAMLTGKDMKELYGKKVFLDAFVQGGIYTSVASVPQSSQHALATALMATADKVFDFFKYDKPYRQKAEQVRKIMTENGFTMPYAKDDLGYIGYGYYFTAAHPAFDDGAKLAMALLGCGVTSVPLIGFSGIHNEGVRLCTATLSKEQLKRLPKRIETFREMYSS